MGNRDKEINALDNYRKGNHSKSDYKRVVRQFSNKDSQNLEKEMKNHWEQIPNDQQLNERMKNLLSDLKASIQGNKIRKMWKIASFYNKAAAILFIPLLAGLLYFSLGKINSNNKAFATIHSPIGARTEFVLPDGSKGWLNSGSKLSYPVDFADNRKVKLNGQAYFNVVHTHNNEKFQVETCALTVEVLGTSFDVSSFEDQCNVNVILEEGSVRILGLNTKEKTLLKPNEKFSYDPKNKNAIITKVNASELCAWTKGILQFRGEPLEEVMQKLGRWYNVEFEIQNDQLKKYGFRATFKDEPLTEILENIKLTTPMSYQIIDGTKDKEGSKGKRKVIIKAN